jgi:hypothetical protein
MVKFKRFLLLSNFSPAALHSLGYAISFALEHEFKLFIVHVISFNAPFTLISFLRRSNSSMELNEKVKVEWRKSSHHIRSYRFVTKQWRCL